MPDNAAESQQVEKKENNSLTKEENDVTLKRFEELETKVNDFYLKPREPLKDDPVFELFDKMENQRE